MYNMRILMIIVFLLYGFSFAQDTGDLDFNKKILYYGIPALAISFAIDKEIKEFVEHNQTDTQKLVWQNITNLGSPYIAVGGVLGYAYGYFTHKDRFLYASILSVQSTAISIAMVLPLKLITNRERPNKENKYSFPSGHTAVAFAFWGSYATVYNKGITPYILYTIPVLVGISRIYLEKHWLSDVVGGAIIGLSSIYLAKKFTNFLSIRFNIGIFINVSSKNVQITYRF